MDLKAKYLSETCSDPIEYLRQLRQTTEPIGGSTIYDEDGELVEYDVAVEAIKKATDAFVQKACKFLSNEANIPLWEGYNDTFGCDTSKFVDNFRKHMEE